MNKSEKLMTYAVGFLLGCLIVMFIQLNKTAAKEAPVNTQALRSVHIQELLRDTKPLDPMLAAFCIESPMDAFGKLQRIMIFENSGPTGYVRAIEVIDNSNNKRKLLTRELMAADQIKAVIEEKTQLELLLNIAASINAELSTDSEIKGIYTLALKSHAPHSIAKYIDLITEQSNGLIQASPIYYTQENLPVDRSST